MDWSFNLTGVRVGCNCESVGERGGQLGEFNRIYMYISFKYIRLRYGRFGISLRFSTQITSKMRNLEYDSPSLKNRKKLHSAQTTSKIKKAKSLKRLALDGHHAQSTRQHRLTR